jgi:hypothetical protein
VARAAGILTGIVVVRTIRSGAAPTGLAGQRKEWMR